MPRYKPLHLSPSLLFIRLKWIYVGIRFLVIFYVCIYIFKDVLVSKLELETEKLLFIFVVVVVVVVGVVCRYYCDYCDTYLTHDSVSDFLHLIWIFSSWIDMIIFVKSLPFWWSACLFMSSGACNVGLACLFCLVRMITGM